MRKRLPIVSALTVLCVLASAGSALGDGLPVPVDASEAGIASANGQARYQAMPDDGSTVVTRVDTDAGEVSGSAVLPGRFGVPLVTLNGTPDGLSADGRTLVLLRPRTSFPRDRTTLAVLDTRRLEPRSTITLDGDFSFDAISPDGRLAYLVEYLDPGDPTAYEVRALDLRRERLLPDPIVDPDEPAEEMGGFPLARSHSPDGRWAYTLYDGRKHPFIHALDTEGGTAKCIDLHGVEKPHRLGLETSPGGERLTLVDPRGRAPVRFVDTASFEVTEPAAEPTADSTPDDGGGVSPMVPIALGVGGLLVALVSVRGRG
jgi:hypothetical protein